MLSELCLAEAMSELDDSVSAIARRGSTNCKGIVRAYFEGGSMWRDEELSGMASLNGKKGELPWIVLIGSKHLFF